jgi:multiple sugar transport system permease protein/raffinose/stachyose/melibiose transport system permease protein
MAAHCLGALSLPAQSRDLLRAVLDHHLPAADHIISLFQILVQYGSTIRGRPHAGLCGDPAAADDLHPGELLRPHPADLFDAARIDGYSEWEIFWRVSFPIALPAIATTVILNFILLWNEFLYAVVLITDEANRTLPLGIQRFMGDQLEDVGMIATGLMIAIVPVIIVYAFFSEKLIQGMTAGAVK